MLTFDPNPVAIPKGSFVEGRFRSGRGEELPVVRPSDGRVINVFREDTAEDADEAVATADRALRSSGWGRQDPRKRGAILRRWTEVLRYFGERADKSQPDAAHFESFEGLFS